MKEGWEYRKLGEVCTKITDGSHNPPKGIGKSDFMMLSSQNIQNGYIDFSQVRYLSKDQFDLENKRTDAKKGDVLLTIVGTIGRTCVITEEDLHLTFQRSVAILKPSVQLNSQFLSYTLISLNDELNKEAHGAAQKGIYLKQLAGVTIPVPPLPEQQSIVEYLDSSFAKIDAMKANAEKALNEAKALFQASLKSLLEPKEGWEEKTLPDISENLDSKRVPVTQNKREKGKYPYYGASGIVDYVSDYLLDEDLLLISEDGANLVARSTPIAFSVSGKIWVNNHAHILRFPHLCTQHFVEYYFASIKIDDYVTGAAQPKFSQKMMNRLPVWIPSLEEQQKIVDSLDSVKAKVSRLQSNFDKISKECDALKQALLKQVFE